MLTIIKLRNDYPEYSIEYENKFITKDHGWVCFRGSPYRHPKGVFDVEIMTVNIGDMCPECGEGALESLYDTEPMDYDCLWCRNCHAVDEEHWWEPLKLKIRWVGK